jgi:hypothetical protein
MKKSIITKQKEIEKLRAQISKIQNKCKHLNANKKHGANTGNYDPSDDCYWTVFDCPDCGKRWTEDGSK